jgi:hypothetical protein
MMKMKIRWATVLISGFIVSCSPNARYEHRLKQELASGVRYDSLFMGLYLGMPEKDFYMHCWKLNQKGLIRQGETNTTVLYETKNELKHPGSLNFYPQFVNGRIYEMPVVFAYDGWAPWNKDLSSDNLEIDVLNWYKKVYGSGFIEVRHSVHGTAFVKIDGNRRITIFKEDDFHVWAIFTDMLVKKNLNNLNKDTIQGNK